MRTTRCYRLLFGFLLALGVGATLASANAEDTTAAGIARILDDATVAAVIVDLERLDVDALVETISAARGNGAAEVQSAQALLQYVGPVLSRFRELGATRVYAVYSLHDVKQQMPYVVVPAANNEQAEQIARFLESGGGGIGSFPSTFAIDDMAIAGSRDLEKRLDPSRVPDRQAGLTKALKVEHEGAIRVVSVVTGDQRRVLAEMSPSLPEEWGGLSGEQLATGIQWLSIDVNLNQGTLQGVIESGDSRSAQRLAAGLPSLMNGIVSAVLPRPAEDPVRTMLGSLKATANGHRITLSTEAPAAARRADVLVSLISRLAPMARDISIRRNLKQLGLGMHNFHAVYGSFPPPASLDESGKALLSWRVYLLPYLDEPALYREFHLDEPWDSPHNRTLIERMPDVFASEHFDLNLEGKTTVQVPVGVQTPFHGRAGVPIREITDGTSVTIMVVEVPRGNAVIWTKPEDFPVNDDPLKPQLFKSRDRFSTAFCDGSARALSDTIPEETLRKLFTHQGGEVVGSF